MFHSLNVRPSLRRVHLLALAILAALGIAMIGSGSVWIEQSRRRAQIRLGSAPMSVRAILLLLLLHAAAIVVLVLLLA